MQPGADLRAVYGRLVEALRELESTGTLNFVHDDELGFLTFCPSNIGTTIRASVHIRLPKLGEEAMREIASRHHLQVRGTRGEHSEGEGGVFDISNERRLGMTEYEAVKDLQDGVLELIKAEKRMSLLQGHDLKPSTDLLRSTTEEIVV
jgi:arginine kinase